MILAAILVYVGGACLMLLLACVAGSVSIRKVNWFRLSLWPVLLAMIPVAIVLFCLNEAYSMVKRSD